MRSLYEELGVSPNASPEEIKAAYRRRARETHPDAGGKREEFQKVQHAYEVLGDDERRRHYDETGDDGTQSEQVPKAAQIIAQEFATFLSLDGFAQVDPVDALRMRINEISINVQRDRKTWSREVERLEKMLKRLRRSHDQSILEDVINGRLAPAHANVRRAQAMLRELGIAAGLLNGYSFSAEDQPAMMFDLIGGFGRERRAEKPKRRRKAA
jgi:curved DNA-binding protein CbpA